MSVRDTQNPFGRALPQPNSGGSGFPNATYLTTGNETADLPNSRALLAGTNITFDDSVPGERTINGSGGGSGATIYTSAYASPPAAPASGDLWFPSDSFYCFRYSGAAWIPWGPLFPMTLPSLAAFTWVNQGTATAVQTNGGIYINSPETAGSGFRILQVAAPATPYTITAALLINLAPQSTQQQWTGLVFRESASGKLQTFGTTQLNGISLPSIMTTKWTSATTFSADYLRKDVVTVTRGLIWLRIADNGVNRICSYSADGINFSTFHSVGRTDFLTADQVGFTVNEVTGVFDVGMTVLSWS